MKRKTKTGVKMITQLVERMSKEDQMMNSDYIYNLVFVYRAYGNFMLEEYDSSVKDYLKANGTKKLTS